MEENDAVLGDLQREGATRGKGEKEGNAQEDREETEEEV